MSTFSTCTSTTRPGSPTDGDVLFETDTPSFLIGEPQYDHAEILNILAGAGWSSDEI